MTAAGLDGAVVIVTGAGGGLGRAFAEGFAAVTMPEHAWIHAMANIVGRTWPAGLRFSRFFSRVN